MKKIYSQPTVRVILLEPMSLLESSPGWSKDGNPPTGVTKESYNNDDEDFLDLE